MIIPEDKKRITTIMNMRKSAKGENLGASPLKPEIVKTADGEMDGRHLASQEMLHAIHEKSPEKFMNALMNFQDLHQSMKELPQNEEA